MERVWGTIEMPGQGRGRIRVEAHNRVGAVGASRQARGKADVDDLVALDAEPGGFAVDVERELRMDGSRRWREQHVERLDHRRLVVRGVDIEPDRARGHTHAQRLALGDGPDLVHDGVEAERPDLPGLARGFVEAGGQPYPVAQCVADGVESRGDRRREESSRGSMTRPVTTSSSAPAPVAPGSSANNASSRAGGAGHRSHLGGRVGFTSSFPPGGRPRACVARASKLASLDSFGLLASVGSSCRVHPALAAAMPRRAGCGASGSQGRRFDVSSAEARTARGCESGVHATASSSRSPIGDSVMASSSASAVVCAFSARAAMAAWAAAWSAMA